MWCNGILPHIFSHQRNDMNSTEPSLEPQGAAPKPGAPGSTPQVGGETHNLSWERSAIEQWVQATLKEQRIARRWKYGLRLAWLVFLTVVVWLGVDKGGVQNTGARHPHTAVVEIKGEIAYGGETSAELIVSSMRSAFEDEGAQAVVLLVNSPGGSPTQSSLLYNRIKSLSKDNKIPVYTFSE